VPPVVHRGDEVVLSAEGPEAEHVLDELSELLERDVDATAAS
jgi:phosphotransferase system HPr-like phosphotransfer protein